MNDQRGVKRLCASCGARFFDLMAKPVCPKCQAEFVIPPPPQPRRPPRPFSRRMEPTRVVMNDADGAPESGETAPILSDEDGEKETREEAETVE